MKCVVLRSPGDMIVEDRPVPARTDAESILVQVKAVGVCGSDIHAYRGTQPFQTYPRVLGHELAGIVAESKGGMEKGQPVTMEPLIRCGRCYPCRQGRYNCCTDLRVIGVHTDGGMCEFIPVPEHLLFSLPKNIPLDQGALCEPMAIACQAIRRSKLTPGLTALVIGAGPIGLVVMQVAKAKGAKVFISDIDPGRLELADRLGADAVINPKEASLERRLQALTGGEGANVVIEAVGSETTIRQAIDVVSAAGRVVLVGLYGGEIALKPISLIRKELDVVGSRNSSGAFPEAISLMEKGRINLAEMITHRFALEEAPEVFRGIEEGRIRPIKAVLLPGD